MRTAWLLGTLLILLGALQIANLAIPLGLAQAPGQPHDPILINGDMEFTPTNGVVGGTGTGTDPYIIEGWQIDASTADGIRIENTNANFVIRNVTVQSVTHGYTGIVFDTVSNGRLENSTLLSNFNGLHLAYASDVTVHRNNMTDNRFSISLYSSNKINFTNNIIANTVEGISIYYSRNIGVQANNFTSSGVLIQGSSIEEYDSHTITLDNTMNGSPIYYYKDCGPQTVRDIMVGQLIVANCSQFQASNLIIANSTLGVEMAFVDNSMIIGSRVSGESLYGIYLTSSRMVTITGSQVGSNLGTGVRLEYSQDVTLANNDVSSNRQYGLFLYSSQTARVYHNNFTSNGVQALDSAGTGNSWDNGYPSGGNYWSDYAGSDDCGGVGQNVCTGPDGIGDAPYPIIGGGDDHYPLVQPSVPDAAPPYWPQGSSLTASNLGPTGLTLSWTAASDNVGVVWYRVYMDDNVLATLDGTVRTYDATGLTSDTSYTFRVEAGDASDNWSTDGPSTTARTAVGMHAPVLDAIGDRTVDEETTLTFTATASDADGDPLVFSFFSPTHLAGASITTSGTFSWTPSEAQGPGSYTMTVAVFDGGFESFDSETFTVNVREVNQLPVLNPVGERTLVKGTSLTFKVNASDPDVPAQTLTFSLTTSTEGVFPNGATITTDGVFSWTPSADQSPGNYVVRIVVSDGEVSNSEQVIVTLTEGQQQGPTLPALAAWAAIGGGVVLAVSLTVWVRLRKKPETT